MKGMGIKMKKVYQVMFGLLFITLIAAGCGSGNQSEPGTGAGSETEPITPPKSETVAPAPGSEPVAPEPVELIFYSAQGKVLEQFGAAELLSRKFPHITLNVINSQVGQRYADLIAAGTLPDIIFESNSLSRGTIIAHDFNYDLEESLLKKHNFDLNRFEPNVLAQARYSNSEGKLYGLPYSVNRYALIYNKDLFERFAVPYPEDGMTWDEIYTLAQRMTRTDGDVFYQGFSISTPGSYMLNNQLSLDPLHPEEDRAHINTDGWKLLFENLKRFYEIPGTSIANNKFLDGVIAMTVQAVSTGQFSQFADTPELNWDLATTPVLKEAPNTGFKPAGLSMFISQTSKNKDEAFQIVEYLVSEEFQTILASNGGGTTLASEKVRSAAGTNLPVAEGKNVQALYYYELAPSSLPRANHLTNVSVNFANAFAKMIDNNLDVNTVLRDLEEEINKAIAEAKAGG